MPLPKKERRLKKDIFFLLSIIALLVLGLECVSKLLISQKSDLPFWHSKEEAIYPMLHNKLVNYSPNNTNVLLLGGSTLFYVGKRIQLENLGDEHYFNLSHSVHSSLDSVHKYHYLISQGYTFDYVIFYHGINEVRFNNIPTNLFLDNYDHVHFYRFANAVFDSGNPFLHILLKSSLGFRLYEFYVRVKYMETSISKGRISKEWIPFGKDIKTNSSFEHNLLTIMQLAKSKNATMITPKFAFHVPKNYSKQLFSDHSLGYQRNHNAKNSRSDCCHIELWGKPSHVIKGIEIHNEIIIRLQDNFRYVDTSHISADINKFYDICHFSRKGEKEFIELVVNAIKENRYTSEGNWQEQRE